MILVIGDLRMVRTTSSLPSVATLPKCTASNGHLPEELAHPLAFSGWRYLELDVNALYDGKRLVQKFDMWSGNGMMLVFRQKKD